MEISFFGAARTVTGSAFLLEHEGFSLLVDLGLPQGKDERTLGLELPFSPYTVDAVILTHAHIDHSGRLPLLAKLGYSGPIYSTKATFQLSDIMLEDSAHIQESEAEWKNRKKKRHGEEPVEPLYNAEDAEAALSLFRCVNYNEKIELTPHLWFEMIDAGHLLGSASVRVHALLPDGSEKSIVFSGDIGNTDQPIIKNPMYFHDADFVVMESTYGDRLHGKREEDETAGLLKRAKKLASITDRTFRRGGNLVIPSFAVGRTQEILYLFRLIMDRKMLDYEIPVFLDSPLSVKATRVFSSCLRSDYFDEDAMALVKKGVNPILFPSLVTITDVNDSKALNERKESAVIISSSGMCEAGRIRHHLKHNLWRPESTILFVGYQAEGTLGRSLVDGTDHVTLLGEQISVKAEIAILEGTSGHADQKGLIKWIGEFEKKPEAVFVVHGEENTSEYFASKLKNEEGLHAYAPKFGERFDLLKDEIPIQSDTALRKKTGADLRDAFDNLEKEEKSLRSVIERMAMASAAIDLSNEKKAHKLADAVRRLSDDIAFLSEKWGGDIE